MDGQYFDDMWLALEQELTQYDSFLSDDWGAGNNEPYTSEDSPNAADGGATLTPETFEELLEQRSEGPSSQELRSKNRAERIQAVKELYNQVPTIISASSLAQMHRTANRLYKAGRVRQANGIVSKAEQTVVDFSYVEDTSNFTGTIQKQGSEIVVEITDKQSDEAITLTKTCDSLLDAIKFYLKSTKGKVE